MPHHEPRRTPPPDYDSGAIPAFPSLTPVLSRRAFPCQRSPPRKVPLPCPVRPSGRCFLLLRRSASQFLGFHLPSGPILVCLSSVTHSLASPDSCPTCLSTRFFSRPGCPSSPLLQFLDIGALNSTPEDDSSISHSETSSESFISFRIASRTAIWAVTCSRSVPSFENRLGPLVCLFSPPHALEYLHHPRRPRPRKRTACSTTSGLRKTID